MQLRTKSGKALYTKEGVVISGKPYVTPPSGITSYWQQNHPVTHGYQLIVNQSNFYTDKLGVYAGIPPGTSFTSTTSGDWTIDTPGTYSDVNHSGRIIVAANNVKLVRVKARQTTATYTLNVPSNFSGFEAIDCEFSGGTSITVYAQGRFVRCLAYEGNDCTRPRGSKFEWIESVAWWVSRNAPDSHSDAMQFTNGAAGVINQIDAQRSVMVAWNPDLNDRHNSAVQTGSWQGHNDTSGVTGQIVDCFVDGGHVCVNAGGGSSWPMVTVQYRRNRWGLEMDSSASNSTGGNVVWENTNVWHKSGTTAYGGTVVADTPV